VIVVQIHVITVVIVHKVYLLISITGRANIKAGVLVMAPAFLFIGLTVQELCSREEQKARSREKTLEIISEFFKQEKNGK